jgi:hypothetical protein
MLRIEQQQARTVAILRAVRKLGNVTVQFVDASPNWGSDYTNLAFLGIRKPCRIARKPRAGARRSHLPDTSNYRNVAPLWWNGHDPGCRECAEERSIIFEGNSTETGKRRPGASGPRTVPESCTSLIPSACFEEGAVTATLEQDARRFSGCYEHRKLGASAEILARTRPVGQWN